MSVDQVKAESFVEALSKPLGLVRPIQDGQAYSVFDISGVFTTLNEPTVLETEVIQTCIHFTSSFDGVERSDTYPSTKSLPEVLNAIRNMGNRLPINLGNGSEYRSPLAPEIRQEPHKSEIIEGFKADVRKAELDFNDVTALTTYHIENPSPQGDMLLLDRTKVHFGEDDVVEIRLGALEVLNQLQYTQGAKQAVTVNQETGQWQDGGSLGWGRNSWVYSPKPLLG